MANGDNRHKQGRGRQRGFINGTLPMLVKRAVVVQAILTLAFIWTYAGWRILGDQAETLDSARHELTAIAAGMYVHLQAVLNDSLGAARAAARSLNMEGGIRTVPPMRASELLARELSSGDYVRGLFLATHDRFLGAARDLPMQSLAAPPQWLWPALRGESEIYVGPMIVDPVEGSQHAIPVAVRSSDTDGPLWLGALLGVEALDQLYESMAIHDGTLSLVSTRGDLLLRVPAVPNAKNPINIGQASLFRKAAQLPFEGGIVEDSSPVAEGTWVYAVRRLQGYQLAVAAARSRQAILQPWRDRTQSLVLVLAGVSVLFVGLTALLQHFVRRLERANTTLAQLNSELETRVAARTAELQAANRELALTNQELEAFTASASHDLRSPLGAIAGQAGLLHDELRPSMTDAVRQRLERIQSSVMRSSEIIDGLLSLARISRQELLSERVDLSALARTLVDDLRQQYPRHAVDCMIEPKLVVNADPRLVKSLLANLLGNAWKYTAKTLSARVELGRSLAQGTTVFWVRDNGTGFDMAGATRIFEPFQRMHSADEFPGVGIGLATVARIVHRYAGKITVDSEPGKGTTFRFTLPAAALGPTQVSD